MKKYNLPKGYSFLQSLYRSLEQIKDPLGATVESMDKFGGTYSVNLGPRRRMIATQDPGFIDYVLRSNHRNYNKSEILTWQLGRFIGNGLLTANGDYWLKQRRLIQPGFHYEKIQALYGIIKRTVDEFLVSFPVGERVNVYPLMNKLAFEIVVNTLFDIQVPQSDRDILSEFITETQDFVIKDIRSPHKSWWFELSGEVKRNMKRAEGARKVISGIIRQRQESGKHPGDLLDMLLDARYEDSGLPMEERQIIDEIMILIIAGHETTANALSWTLYLLANHRDQLLKLRQLSHDFSINQCVASDELNAVIKESMRLYPPAWISDRVSLQDDEYGGYAYPAGTIIVIFYYGLHHDPRFWNQSEAFQPERFLKVNEEKDKPKAYYPFGGGPRLCIGNNFATAEMVIFLQAMIRKFDLLSLGEVPAMKPLITLRPVSVHLGIQPR